MFYRRVDPVGRAIHLARDLHTCHRAQACFLLPILQQCLCEQADASPNVDLEMARQHVDCLDHCLAWTPSCHHRKATTGCHLVDGPKCASTIGRKEAAVLEVRCLALVHDHFFLYLALICIMRAIATSSLNVDSASSRQRR